MGTEVRFVGSIPELYDRHMGPVLFEPYARDLARRLPSGARRVLELAAGTGRVTWHLLGALPPDGTLVATDLNEPMLEVAKKRIGTDPRVTYRQADMQEIPLADDSVDAIVCQFGLMFVPDKPRAMAQMRRVLAPGGVLLLSVWDELANNPATAAFQDLTMATFPDDPPMFMRTPFSMGDASELERLATGAGFKAVRVETVGTTGESESATHLATGLVRGNPLWNQLSERGVDGPAFEARVAAEMARRFGEKPCRSALSAHVLTAFA
jgi:ubiquinone/menaquinone biosynthesis C-methylase UbiE